MNNVLSDLVLPQRQNQHWEYSGIDSPDHCYDPVHFQNYPHSISYHYNSRGFRDAEWPQDQRQLQQAIWCVGDSFTVGLGLALPDIWPQLLSKQANQRTINVSMDGASNQWISRRARDICQAVQPQSLVVHWSFLHRRELDNAELNDEQRRVHMTAADNDQDMARFHQDIVALEKFNSTTQIIHSTIPGFSDRDIVRRHMLKSLVPVQRVVEYFEPVDLSRDGFHYGKQTAHALALKIQNLLTQ